MKLPQFLITVTNKQTCLRFRTFSFPLQEPPDWQEILNHFRGSELQNYFTRIQEGVLKVMFMSLFNTLNHIIEILQ